MEIEQVFAYRITHIDNIRHVIQFGITHKNSTNANPNFVSIGDRSLIDMRSLKSVIITNGNLTLKNRTSITLGDFIPFYFGVKMPMLYVIQMGGNFVEIPVNPENIVYIACPVNDIINSNFTYYFSDGHATDNFTTFYDKSKIKELPSLINWKAIKTSYWGGHENLDLKRQKQAEFLISEDIPFHHIFGIGCYNQSAKDTLIKMGIDESKIKIITSAYY